LKTWRFEKRGEKGVKGKTSDRCGSLDWGPWKEKRGLVQERKVEGMERGMEGEGGGLWGEA